LDRSILTGFLDEVEIGLIEDGTAIGLGLATAVNRLRHSEAESKTVILLTDGSNNVPTLEPETAAELAHALGVRVYTIGVGKRGRVPFPRTGAFGTRTVMVEMPIDEELLKSIAEITGGRYWRAENPEALNEVFASIDELETSRYKTSVSTWYDERMPLMILPALLLLLMESLLGATWLRRLP
jgi:Ca-activated chloride channel family protein